ncbi:MULTISPECIES: hypothetical protein [unclassified Streptomyces]|uniref:hypothetical protein n=1 Tax=unclassified Streptomyces TaxID=2593676 RepID=UPI000DAD3DB4|nr:MULTISPECIES: hypothetical protein [unclassified Streptomyces]
MDGQQQERKRTERLSDFAPSLRRPGHLEALDGKHRGEEDEWELYWIRLPLIAARTGVDEAVERTCAHPESVTWYAAGHIAGLPADAGRTEEAVTVLQRHADRNSHDLAGYLIGLGQIDEALTVLQQPRPQPP